MGMARAGGDDLVAMEEKLFVVVLVFGYACCFSLWIVSGSELKN